MQTKQVTTTSITAAPVHHRNQFLPINGSVSKAVVNPIVIFNVCDSYVRRNSNVTRVIGTLLGYYDQKKNSLEVTNSFCVPHNEQNGQVLLDVEFHRAMIELHQRVNQKEIVLGWYSSGDGISSASSLIHEFYAKEMGMSISAPLHLTFDVEFKDTDKLVRAWLGRSLDFGVSSALRKKEQEKHANASTKDNAKKEETNNKESTNENNNNDKDDEDDYGMSSACFQEISCVTNFEQAERVGFDALSKTKTEKTLKETATEALQKTVEKIEMLLEECKQRATENEDVSAVGNSRVGRLVAEVLRATPELTNDQFERVFGDNGKDCMMISYLTNATKIQLSLAEKLHTASFLV
jgi:translation initiation factor 3 subunit F